MTLKEKDKLEAALRYLGVMRDGTDESASNKCVVMRGNAYDRSIRDILDILPGLIEEIASRNREHQI